MGREFVRRVLGDIDGAETDDYLSGIDYLGKKGTVDRKRSGRKLPAAIDYTAWVAADIRTILDSADVLESVK